MDRRGAANGVDVPDGFDRAHTTYMRANRWAEREIIDGSCRELPKGIRLVLSNTTNLYEEKGTKSRFIVLWKSAGFILTTCGKVQIMWATALATNKLRWKRCLYVANAGTGDRDQVRQPGRSMSAGRS